MTVIIKYLWKFKNNYRKTQFKSNTKRNYQSIDTFGDKTNKNIKLTHRYNWTITKWPKRLVFTNDEKYRSVCSYRCCVIISLFDSTRCKIISRKKSRCKVPRLEVFPQPPPFVKSSSRFQELCSIHFIYSFCPKNNFVQ